MSEKNPDLRIIFKKYISACGEEKQLINYYKNNLHQFWKDLPNEYDSDNCYIKDIHIDNIIDICRNILKIDLYYWVRGSCIKINYKTFRKAIIDYYKQKLYIQNQIKLIKKAAQELEKLEISNTDIGDILYFGWDVIKDDV